MSQRDAWEVDNQLAAWRRLYTEAARDDLRHPFDRDMIVSTLRLMTMGHVLLGKMVAGGAVSVTVSLTQAAVDSIVPEFRRLADEGVPKAATLRKIADTLEAVAPDLVGARPLPIDVLYLAMTAWAQDEPFTYEDYGVDGPSLYTYSLGQYAEFLGLARRVRSAPERPQATHVPPPAAAPAPSTRVAEVCDALAGAADLVATNPAAAAAIVRNAIAELRRS